jgi:hypothetical protein
MKKVVLIFVVLASLPLAVFAEWGFGGAAFLKSPVLVGESIDTDDLNVTQFSFGGDARFKYDGFQAEALLLYSAGDVRSLNAYLDLGVAVDLSILRLSAGAGPNLTNNFGDSPAVQAGLNAKVAADIMLGEMSLGLSYIMAMNLDDGIAIDTSTGLLGASLLIWMK